MSLFGIRKKAAVGIDDTIKWIIWIAILIVAGFGVREIVTKAIG